MPRPAYALACVLWISLGLASRRYAHAVPQFLAAYAGDTVYAATAYCLLSLILPNVAPLRRATYSLAYCYAIEFSQLLHYGWLDRVRSTLPGHLVLGQGFLRSDLACYASGIVLTVALELLARALLGARLPVPRAD